MLWGTQVWLMGDGQGDSYSSIRNQVYWGSGNTRLHLISMLSNDIETINIEDLN